MGGQFEVGDEVQVTLPSGVFVGRIKQKIKGYNWTDETWCLVHGDKPERFVTITKEKSLSPAND